MAHAEDAAILQSSYEAGLAALKPPGPDTPSGTSEPGSSPWNPSLGPPRSFRGMRGRQGHCKLRTSGAQAREELLTLSLYAALDAAQGRPLPAFSNWVSAQRKGAKAAVLAPFAPGSLPTVLFLDRGCEAPRSARCFALFGALLARLLPGLEVAPRFREDFIADHGLENGGLFLDWDLVPGHTRPPAIGMVDR